MKAIINEKMYDTTTSSVIFADGTEALFKTKNGAYFRTSSEGINPMTEDEARILLEFMMLMHISRNLDQ